MWCVRSHNYNAQITTPLCRAPCLSNLLVSQLQRKIQKLIVSGFRVSNKLEQAGLHGDLFNVKGS